MLSRPWAMVSYSIVLLMTFVVAGFVRPFATMPLMPVLGTATLVVVGVVVNLMRTQVLVELAASELASSTILSSMAEGVVVHAADGKIVSFNPAAPAILGVSGDQLLGKSNAHSQFKTFDESGGVITPDQHPSSVALNEGRSVVNFPMRVTRADGSTVHLLVNASPIFDRDREKASFAVVTFQDVTGLREAEAQLKEQQGILIANTKFSALGEVAAVIAHEINNPLTILTMHVEYLKILIDQQELDRPLAHRELDSMLMTIGRVSRIIRSMRSLVRESSHDPFEPVSLRRIVDDTLEILREKLRLASVNVAIPLS